MTSPEYLTLPERPIADQLLVFAKEFHGTPYRSMTLRDPGKNFDIFVRTGRRDIGATAGIVLGGGECTRIGDFTDTLEIASIDSYGPPEPVIFWDFVELALRVSPWEAVCAENIGDENIAAWCERHNWESRSNNRTEVLCLYAPRNEGFIYGLDRDIPPDMLATIGAAAVQVLPMP